jgi:hypothetical protein
MCFDGPVWPDFQSTQPLRSQLHQYTNTVIAILFKSMFHIDMEDVLTMNKPSGTNESSESHKKQCVPSCTDLHPTSVKGGESSKATSKAVIWKDAQDMAAVRKTG